MFALRKLAPTCMIIAVVGTLPAQQPSAADVLEHRVPDPPAAGVRKLDVGWEMAAPIGQAPVLKHRDGRLMMIGAGKVAYSGDGGRSWSEPNPLPARLEGAIRLDSGKLGGPAPLRDRAEGELWEHYLAGLHFFVSGDEGKTWQRRGKMSVGSVPAWPYKNTLIQTSSGRLIQPVRFTGGAGHKGLYAATGSWGLLSGKMTPIEGHAHWPEPDIAYAFYSDDEGRTWHRSDGGIMVWHQDGHGGMWPCDEPSVMEVENGDVMMYCRTTLGRIYTARSRQTEEVTSKGEQVVYRPGQRFDLPESTPLAGSYSPCAIVRIPKTGDLLLAWNQVSGDEIRAGYRRGRLSSAISKDDGKTWQHFRTIDTSVLPPAGRVAPDPQPRMARGLDYVGELPADYGGVSYPMLSPVDEMVFVSWARSVVNAGPGDVTGRRLRAVPLEWFYQDDPPLPSGPKVIINVPSRRAGTHTAYEIPSDFYQGRFYGHSRDLARHLKSPLGRLNQSMYGPLHQVITALGWTPRYDRSHLDDSQDPRLVVTVERPK